MIRENADANKFYPVEIYSKLIKSIYYHEYRKYLSDISIKETKKVDVSILINNNIWYFYDFITIPYKIESAVSHYREFDFSDHQYYGENIHDITKEISSTAFDIRKIIEGKILIYSKSKS